MNEDKLVNKNNRYVLETLEELNENSQFKTLLEWGVVYMRVTAFEKNSDFEGEMLDEKYFNEIVEAIDFVIQNENDVAIFVYGGEDGLNILDV